MRGQVYCTNTAAHHTLLSSSQQLPSNTACSRYRYGTLTEGHTPRLRALTSCCHPQVVTVAGHPVAGLPRALPSAKPQTDPQLYPPSSKQYNGTELNRVVRECAGLRLPSTPLHQRNRQLWAVARGVRRGAGAAASDRRRAVTYGRPRRNAKKDMTRALAWQAQGKVWVGSRGSRGSTGRSAMAARPGKQAANVGWAPTTCRQ